MDRGYLENKEERKGRPAKLVVADAPRSSAGAGSDADPGD
jgi:hypothetical protein